MHNLSNLTIRRGSRKARRRVGRGTSSGQGKTAGRGLNGQKSRSGGVKRPGFEGGQTPLYRRLPKHRGFKNLLFSVSYTPVNLSHLVTQKLSTFTPVELVQLGMAQEGDLIKILGGGEITRPINIRAHAFSKSAREKIEAAGGKAEVVSRPRRGE